MYGQLLTINNTETGDGEILEPQEAVAPHMAAFRSNRCEHRFAG